MVLMVLLTGCINPQTTIIETEYYKTGEIKNKTITTKTQAHAVKQICFGLKIGLELESKIPIVYFGIIKREYIVGDEKVLPFIDEDYSDINLLLGQGWVTSYMGIEKLKK